MKKLNILIGIAVLAILFSCEKENESNIQENQEILDLVSIVDIDTRMQSLLEVNGDNGNRNPDPCTYVIVSWDGEWGRASRNCDGWGLCNSNWFYWDCSGNRSGNSSAPLEFDTAANKHYIDILFSEPVPSNIPIEDLALAIDEEFQVFIESENKNLVFNNALYPYNENLGDFGGIRIYLD